MNWVEVSRALLGAGAMIGGVSLAWATAVATVDHWDRRRRQREALERIERILRQESTPHDR